METFEVGDQRRLSFRIKVDWPVTLETKKGLVEEKNKRHKCWRGSYTLAQSIYS